jgi:hypothetical protein
MKTKKDKTKTEIKNKTKKERPREIYKESYNIAQKIALSNRIRNITETDLLNDYNNLVDEGKKLKDNSKYEISGFSRIGNKAVDYFTFYERLNTRGPKKISFYELWNNKSVFKKKPFVKSFIYNSYTSRNRKMTEIQIYYKVFTMYYGSIYIFKPTLAIDIYNRFKPECVLDMTMGWGGRLLGACAIDIPKYIGIDMNINLKDPYKKMKRFLKEKTNTKTEFDLRYEDALKVDYSKLSYDMVFTSPPYYNIEKYGDQPETLDKYDTKDYWNNIFYNPLITKTFKYLKIGGYYCLNIPVEIYENVCIQILGKADILIPLKIKNRNINEYKEYIYVWKKSNKIE